MVKGNFLVESGLQNGVLTFEGQQFSLKNLTVTRPDTDGIIGELSCEFEDEKTCEVTFQGEMQVKKKLSFYIVKLQTVKYFLLVIIL